MGLTTADMLFIAFAEVLLVAFGVFFDDVARQQIDHVYRLTVFGFLCVVFVLLLRLVGVSIAACSSWRVPDNFSRVISSPAVGRGQIAPVRLRVGG